MIYPEAHEGYAVYQDGKVVKTKTVASGRVYIDGVAKGAFTMLSLDKKDKNGKEIFIDDILKAEGEKKLIHLESMGSMDVSITYSGIYLGAFESSELEVVGNIYENPELREGAGRV